MAAIRYFVTAVDQAITFYTTTFDFIVQHKFGPNMAILRRGDLTL